MGHPVPGAAPVGLPWGRGRPRRGAPVALPRGPPRHLRRVHGGLPAPGSWVPRCPLGSGGRV
eukprot:9078827-Alexandrium_andersonii.AAC.1